MSLGEIVLLIVGFIEFIIICVVCSKSTDIESTCASCHCKTNFNRDDWQKYFNNKKEELNK